MSRLDLKEKAQAWLVNSSEDLSKWRLQPHVDSLTALLESVAEETQQRAIAVCVEALRRMKMLEKHR